MTNAIFKFLDPTSIPEGEKGWNKVDVSVWSFTQSDVARPVNNMRGREHEFGTDVSGFAVYNHPAAEKSFTEDEKVREGYYQEVEALLREKLPGIKKVHIFDHTIRRRIKDAPRQPVQQVHVDQTPRAAAARVRRHLPADEAEELLKGRYQIINVWRPIENNATDMPLAVVDWRTTEPKDFIAIDLLYPKRADSVHDDDDRGKEKRPEESTWSSLEGYEVKGETLGVASNDGHKFWYQKDMTPDEVLLLKCFDSRADGVPAEFGEDVKGVAMRTPHTAFVDPDTPKDAPGRQSIEVRCLVFYE